MRKASQIKAYLFLIIISVFTAHNAFPHVHHQHNEEHAPHTEHQGSHHHSEENSTEYNILLDLLSKNHSHSGHTHQFTSTPTTTFSTKSAKEFGVITIIQKEYWSIRSGYIDSDLQKFTLYTNLLTHQPPYLQAYPHRGPPSLG
ncbi:hypothetical protein JMN32_15245 [Fulvivirga sp. 29W222]|uniref:Uncharacterized protein n=1 Tax=Fulvivirga marina TaxID=2494733 RepID=A0A937FZF4_9BACT|nr:hypothetical protein [Fulvivirga marina]MBL6447672.1 hypothetical protein [Fulvivirga marina]